MSSCAFLISHAHSLTHSIFLLPHSDTLTTETPLPLDLVAAYKPAVLLSLQGLRESGGRVDSSTPAPIFTPAGAGAGSGAGAWAEAGVGGTAIQAHMGWLVTLLPRLVVCHDRDVRMELSLLLSDCVLPLLL